MEFSFAGTPEEMGIALEHFGYTVKEAHSGITEHAHAHFEVCLVTQGMVEYMVGCNRYVLRAGSLCTTRPGELHCMKPLDNQGWAAYFINIRRIDYDNLKDPLLSSKVKVLEDMMRLAPFFEDIIKEANSPRFATVMRVHSLVITILVELLRSTIAESQEQLTLPFSEPVSKAMVYISYKGTYQTSLKDIASHVGVSVSWLSSKFSKETKTTLRSCLRQILSEKAKRQLEDGDVSITAIAGNLGFPDVPTFSAFFKRYQKLPPSLYRLRAQGSRAGNTAVDPVIFDPAS